MGCNTKPTRGGGLHIWGGYCTVVHTVLQISSFPLSNAAPGRFQQSRAACQRQSPTPRTIAPPPRHPPKRPTRTSPPAAQHSVDPSPPPHVPCCVLKCHPSATLTLCGPLPRLSAVRPSRLGGTAGAGGARALAQSVCTRRAVLHSQFALWSGVPQPQTHADDLFALCRLNAKFPN